MLVGAAVAAELGADFAYATAGPGSRPGHVRYAVSPAVGSMLEDRRVLVVDDVVSCGSAPLACVRDVGRWGGTVAAIGCVLGRRSARTAFAADLDVDLVSVVEDEWGTWAPTECPLCRRAVMLERRF
jgi:adenine/guanine phosphoribosyltransferase-like PRPP-binding protein